MSLMSREPSRRIEIAAAILVLAAAVAAYASSLSNGFVGDDHYLVENNPLLERGPGFSDLFLKPWGAEASGEYERRMNQGYYRPLAVALFAIEHRLWDGNPLGHHAVNVLLHAVTSLLVFWFARRFLGFKGALAASLLFALHAVHSEAVDAVYYRTTLLEGLLCIAALHVHGSTEPGPKGRLRGHILVMLLYILALFGKETAFPLPLYLVLYDLFIRRIRIAALDRTRYAGLALMAIGYVVLRGHVTSSGSIAYFAGVPVWSVMLTMSGVFALYLRLLVWPHPLCAFYEWSILPPVDDPLSPFALLGLAAVTGYLVLAAGAVVRKAPVLSFGLWLLPISLLPVLHIIPILNVAAERFLYMGSLGFCLLVGLGFDAIMERPGRALRYAAITILLAYLLVHAALTVRRNRAWADDESLYRATIQDHPRSLSSRLGLGRILLLRGKANEAIEQAKGAMAIAPDLEAPRQLEHAALEAVRNQERK